MAPALKVPVTGAAANPCEGGERKTINPELWYACAGPLVSLPPVGSYVVYFPQGHSEQVAASMQKDADAHIPNYPNLPPKLICLLHNVTLHADVETDEVYAQMTLQPVNTYEKEALLASDLALKPNRPQTEFFCKTLTASDTSTHGGFSVPRRAAEKIFPSLDFTMQPPAQELVAKDLHDNTWTFRHIYRGQPKRHLLTTGWSLFVSGKRLFAGDSVLFIRDEKQQLLLGTRRANRQPTNISSSVLSSDSMHIGILAAAAHAAANHSPFTIFYNPRASPSEFVIPLAKYNKAIYSNQISLGMRFRMMFETEESGTRRYMGTITGISDLDSVRWKNSPWRNLQVGWDESTAGERRNRVSIWEIEPVAAPFFICPPPFFRTKRPRQPGMPDDDSSDMENLFKRTVPWLGEDHQSQGSLVSGLSLVQWMNMQQNPTITNSALQTDYVRSLTGSGLQNIAATDLSRQLSLQSQLLQQNGLQFNASRPPQQNQQLEQLLKGPSALNTMNSINQVPQQHLESINQQRQQLLNQTLSVNQCQGQMLQPQVLVQNSAVQQPPPLTHNHQSQAHNILGQQQQQQQQQQQNPSQNISINPNQPGMPAVLANSNNQQLPNSDHQNPLQLIQKFQHQQASLPLQPPVHPLQFTQLQEQQRQLLEVSQQLPISNSVSQQQLVPPQIAKSALTNAQFSQCLQTQPKFQHPGGVLADFPGLVVPSPPITNTLSTPSHCILPSNGAQSVVTDDLPSCSTSPSTNNSSVLPQIIMNKPSRGTIAGEEMAHSGSTILSPGTLEAVASSSPTLVKEPQQSDCRVKSSLPVSKSQTQNQTGLPHTYLTSLPQMDYLDTSSSGTSVCLSQTDGSLQQSLPLSSFNPSALLFRDTVHDVEGQADPRSTLYGGNIDGVTGFLPLTSDPLTGKGIGSEKDFQSQLASGNMLASFESSKEVQQDMSSICQSFGVPNVAFDAGGVSMDSTINDGSFLNGGGSWAPAPPQYQRMRTFTKVYKRGAVGRSVDITRYSGYDELKQDLARRFGIEGQLEDRHKVGWKLVYVDHENDVLLVGDDPWEEFVKCVRCIKILSPQEVQQMSLDGDFGNNILPNQACSSSDGGNAWRSGNGHCDQNSGNPSGGSYDR